MKIQSETYRPEIDGLRAVAIVPVVLFHAGLGFPGGFIGVDVFFVISGFLITSIILEGVKTGTFSYLRFYERRIRRLVPSLLAVLIFSAICSFFLLEGPAYKEFSLSLTSALTAWSNWFFQAHGGYFDATAETKPLLHLWSLAIEEQFYFVVPALLILFTRFVGGHVRALILAMLAASLAYAVWLIQAGLAETAFYSSFARIWELAAGAALAAGVVAPGGLSAAARVIGSVFILVPIFLYSKSTPFPGIAAIPPVIGTALIIWAGTKRDSFVFPVLASRPFVEIGKVSYAWYLWHWPLLVFLPMAFPEAGTTGKIAAVLLSLLLAAISTHTIEKYVRQKSTMQTRFAAYGFYAAGVAVTFAIASIAFYHPFQSARRYALYGPTAEAVRAVQDQVEFLSKRVRSVNWDGESAPMRDGETGMACSFDKKNTHARLLDCLERQAAPHNVLVIGDSVGRDSYLALRDAYPGVRFLAINQSGCVPAEHTPPGWEEFKTSNAAICYPGLYSIINDLTASGAELDYIILSYRYRPKTWYAVSESIPVLQKTAPVILVGAGPTFRLTMEGYLKSLPWGEELPRTIPESDLSMVPWSYESITAGAAKVAAKLRVPFVNINDDYCPNKECILWTTTPREPLFGDEMHVSQYGHEFLANVFREEPIFQSEMAKVPRITD